jgi:carbamoyl-phosphate synthase large subunit
MPPHTLSAPVVAELKRQAALLADALDVRGLLNVQFAVKGGKDIYIIEANPRASRTVPFVSKASGVQWAKVAARVMVGKRLSELGVSEPRDPPYFSIKACVFPFAKFRGFDPLLGPEMRSTGEVMGIDTSFAGGYGRAELAGGIRLPLSGGAFVSVNDGDKEEVVEVARSLQQLGFSLYATAGTATFLSAQGVEVETVQKVREGSPHVIDLLGSGKVSIVINTPEGHGTFLDSRSIRLVANELRIPIFTTLAAVAAAVDAIALLRTPAERMVTSLQEYHSRLTGM